MNLVLKAPNSNNALETLAGVLVCLAAIILWIPKRHSNGVNAVALLRKNKAVSKIFEWLEFVLTKLLENAADDFFAPALDLCANIFLAFKNMLDVFLANLSDLFFVV